MPTPLEGFFSYARERDDHLVRRLHGLVESELSMGISKTDGFELYFDTVHNRQGENYFRRIARSLSVCTSFCWVQTPRWFESNICQLELEAFQEHVENLADRSGVERIELRDLMLNPIRLRPHCEDAPKSALAADLFDTCHTDLLPDLVNPSRPEAFDYAARRVGRNAQDGLRGLLQRIGGVASWRRLTGDRGAFVDRWSRTMQASVRRALSRDAPVSAADNHLLAAQHRLAQMYNGGETTRRGMVLVPASDGQSCFFVARQPYMGRHFNRAEATAAISEAAARGLTLPDPPQSSSIRRLIGLPVPLRRELRAPEALPFWSLRLDGGLELVGDGEVGFIYPVEDV